MGRFVVVVMLTLAAGFPGLNAVSPVSAQSWTMTDRGFRIDFETAQTRRGTVLRGYLNNETGYTAANIRLIVESVDAGGQVTASNVAYLMGTAPPFGRLYFEAPVTTPAPSYRLRVGSWEPAARGGA
jgi:hypothetical protein